MLGGGLKLRWERRYCCIMGHLFVVYAEQGAVAPLGLLSLVDASVERRKEPSQFVIRPRSGSRLLLRPIKESDIAETSLWIDALQRAIKAEAK